MSEEKPWEKPGKWFVCPYNFEEEVRKGWTIPEKIIIHDTTLRDGEQTPGVVFRSDEKIEIAKKLAEIGVHRVEGAIPSVSEDDRIALKRMKKEVSGPEIWAEIRTREDDLNLALECDVDGIIVEIPVPDEIRKIIWRDPEKGIRAHVEILNRAKEHGLKVTSFLPFATVAPLEKLREIAVAAVNEGKADYVAIVDTTGVALPWTIQWLTRKVKEFCKAPIEIHCHNSWGYAVSNTIAGVISGAEVIHTSVNGLGGNAALEECVMGLLALLGVDLRVNTEKLYEASQLVEKYSGLSCYKPLFDRVDRYVEIGILAAFNWKAKEMGVKLPGALNPAVIGIKEGKKLILGKKSGKYAVMLKAQELGLPVPSEDKARIMVQRIKELSIKKKGPITDDEFREIYNEVGP